MVDNEPRMPAAWPPSMTPEEDFDVARIDALTADISTVDVWDLQRRFEVAFAETVAQGRADRALQLLAGACSIVLRPSDKANAWGARYTAGAARSPSVEDFSDQQGRVLASVAAQLAHPGLRARLADLAWSADRKNGRAAGVAIAAYCDCANRLTKGRAQVRFGPAGQASLEALNYVERALYLARRIKKRGAQPSEVVDSLKRVYSAAKRERQFVVFENAARLALYYQLMTPKVIAADAERLARTSKRGDYAMAVKTVLDLAAELHEMSGDAEARRRCQLASVRRTLRMRDEVSTSGAEAHWVQSALFELRHVPGTESVRRRLRRELRDLQEDSLGEFGVSRIPLDLGDERDRALRAFETLDLPDALRELACISRCPSIAELRAQALQSLESSPLGGMMSAIYSDADGKIAATSPGAPANEMPDEAWFKAKINSHEQLRRYIILASRFEPARQALSARYDLEERHFAPIVARSPFVRRDQLPLMTLGFARLLQGDYRSAVHLLIPQIEPSLRYLLRGAGHDPAVEFDDMTEEDIGLPSMLTRFRSQLEAILPPEIVLEIELLFHHRPGSALRHAVAHGMIGAGGCFSDDAVFACWLLYQLTCMPLLRGWNEHVAPEIRAVS